MNNHTLFDIATDWDLFCEFADTEAAWTEDEFNSTPVAKKLRTLLDAFGSGSEGRNQLAANYVDGVYPCENGVRESLIDMDFYDALKTTHRTIHGNVCDSVAALIESEYGIH